MNHWYTRIPAALILISSLFVSGCAAFVAGGAIATGMAVHDRRSFGTVVDDNTLEFRASDAIYQGDMFDTNDRIKISSFNGWVLLAGEVRTEDRVAEAEKRVARLNGVRRVINELEPIEKETIGQRTRDTWTSSRVKASMLRIRGLSGFDPSRVRVTTIRGTVYLQGLVTAEEAEEVVEEARRVGGVERVVTVFEYLEDPALAEQDS